MRVNSPAQSHLGARIAPPQGRKKCFDIVMEEFLSR